MLMTWVTDFQVIQSAKRHFQAPVFAPKGMFQPIQARENHLLRHDHKHMVNHNDRHLEILLILRKASNKELLGDDGSGKGYGMLPK